MDIIPSAEYTPVCKQLPDRITVQHSDTALSIRLGDYVVFTLHTLQEFLHPCKIFQDHVLISECMSTKYHGEGIVVVTES